jgi:hypothetical protein
MFCMKCGTQLPDEATFCFKCGVAVGERGACSPAADEGRSGMPSIEDMVAIVIRGKRDGREGNPANHDAVPPELRDAYRAAYRAGVRRREHEPTVDTDTAVLISEPREADHQGYIDGWDNRPFDNTGIHSRVKESYRAGYWKGREAFQQAQHDADAYYDQVEWVARQDYRHNPYRS